MTASDAEKLHRILLEVVKTDEVQLGRRDGYGQVGTVVEILADVKAFEVEFSDACGGLRLRTGRTYESLGLRPEQIMVLRFEPVLSDVAA